ncbi:MAG: hypothetical protein ACM3PY_05950 [Omnitrophica WOR_2 bacterium]
MLRWILFLTSLVFGLAAGLYYGWKINPVEYVNTTPDSLRVDYKTDFVLMVAESYHADGNLDQAAQRLGILGAQNPSETIAQAINFALQHNYAEADMALMQKLSKDLQTWKPTAEPAKP